MNERPAYIQAPGDRDKDYNAWRSSIRVITDKPVSNAKVYVTRLKKEGDPSLDVSDKQQIAWDRGTESFDFQNITADDLQIVAFVGRADGRELKLLPNPQNALAAYHRALPFETGKYTITFQIEAENNLVYKQSYSLLWDGSLADFPVHYRMDPVADQTQK